MARGFEFLEGDVPIKSTVEEALPEALHILETVEADNQDGLSMAALVWGLQGRRVTVEAAQDTIGHMIAIGTVSLSNVLNVQYPPASS